MILSAVRYERQFNLGNYESEKICVEVSPEEGESADDLLNKARSFVDGNRQKANGVRVEAAVEAAVEATAPAKKPAKTSKKAEKAATTTADTFGGLLEELDKLVETPVEALEEACNGIAERFRAINKPGDASPLKKQIVEKLVAYKQKIDAALQPA